MNQREQQGVACAMMSLAAAMGATACTNAGGSVPHVPGPMASALLAFAAQQGIPAAEVAESWKVIDGIATRIARRRLGPNEDAIDNMNAVVFTELGFVREVEHTDPAFLLLPSVVKGRRGGCVGLGALYLVLAERLDLPLAGVLVPGHFFVRALNPSARNVELLRRGQAMPDDWYIRKYGPITGGQPSSPAAEAATAPASASAFMRPLEIPEVIAVHWFNIGNYRLARGDVAGASDAYARATDEFPSFAEAAASLGAVRHLRGDLQAAARSYDIAARAQPDLPGLAHNLTVLDAERNAQSLARPFPIDTEKNHAGGKSPRRLSP